MKLDLIERIDNLCISIGGLVLDNAPVAIGATIIASAITYDVQSSLKHTEKPMKRIELPIPIVPLESYNVSKNADMIKMIESIFNSYGLPKGIGSTMAYYESRFDPKAISKTGCLGLFQFCKGTAEAYGLEDRTDPISSTIAAAELLIDNANALEKRGIELTNVNLYLSHMIGSKGVTLLHHKMKGRNLTRKDRRTLRRVLKPNWYKSMGTLSYRVSTLNTIQFYNHVIRKFNKIQEEINHG